MSFYKKAYFNIDIQNEYYEGYHLPEYRWNGWAMPFFEKSIALIIARNMSNDVADIEYDEKRDSFIYTDKETGEKEEFRKIVISTEEGKKELYEIGTACWVWDDYTIEEVYKDAEAIIYSTENTKDKEENYEYE